MRWLGSASTIGPDVAADSREPAHGAAWKSTGQIVMVGRRRPRMFGRRGTKTGRAFDAGDRHGSAQMRCANSPPRCSQATADGQVGARMQKRTGPAANPRSARRHYSRSSNRDTLRPRVRATRKRIVIHRIGVGRSHGRSGNAFSSSLQPWQDGLFCGDDGLRIADRRPTKSGSGIACLAERPDGPRGSRSAGTAARQYQATPAARPRGAQPPADNRVVHDVDDASHR